MPVDKFGRMSDTKTRDTGVSLTYINNNYIRSDGGTPVSGSINMNGNTLYNVSVPVNPQDVATKEYVDETVSNVSDKKTHIIAAHASYHGDLIEGKFQFTFGGSNVETLKTYDDYNGFLMPHSGYIKRFVVEETGHKFYDDYADKVRLNRLYPLFSLVLIRSIIGGPINYINLGSYYLGFSDINPGDYSYVFRSNLPDGIEKYNKINAKDILNIRSLLDTSPKKRNYLNFQKFGENYVKAIESANEIFHTYLATILIELDPL